MLYVINDLLGAKQVYEEALQIRRELADKNPNIYLSDVAATLNSLGNLLSLTNDLLGAKQCYEEALPIIRLLAKRNPEIYLPKVAATLNNLGILFKASNFMLGAKQAFEESLQITRQLAKKNPDVYLPNLANNLTNLGNLLAATDEMAGAKRAFEEALDFYKEFAKKNPDVYLSHIATVLNNLGNLLAVTNDMTGAKKFFEEALRRRKKLAEENPQKYDLEVVMTAVNLGLLYEQLLISTGDMSLKTSGLNLMRDAEQRFAGFPEEHPRVQYFSPYITRLTKFFKDFDEAAFQFNQALERVGILQGQNEVETDPHQKVLRQEEIINTLLEIEERMPDNEKVNKLTASKYGSLAWYQLFDRQFSAAEQSCRNGLAKDSGEEWINTNLALALLYQGKWEEARQVYEDLKDKAYGDATYKKTFLDDLNALEQAGITHPDVAKARVLLKN